MSLKVDWRSHRTDTTPHRTIAEPHTMASTRSPSPHRGRTVSGLAAGRRRSIHRRNYVDLGGDVRAVSTLDY